MKSLKHFKRTVIAGAIVLFFLIMFIFPYATYQGASSGLLLWFLNVLPTLLPFIIISNLMIKLGIASQISRFLHPVFGRILGLSKDGCYPILVGFLSGIPMGAKTSADLRIEKKISHKEGDFLLSLCNNASPVFIMNFIALNQLQLPRLRVPLFLIVYISTISGALLYRFLKEKWMVPTANHIKLQATHANVPYIDEVNNSQSHSNQFNFHMMDSSIMNGFEVVTKIGGYIILFSILAQILKEIGPATGYVKPIIMGILEITTGINQVCITTLDSNIKIVLVAVLTSFGGLSGIAQTKSVLGDSRLSIKYYFIVKLISAFIALLLSLFYVMIVAP